MSELSQVTSFIQTNIPFLEPYFEEQLPLAQAQMKDRLLNALLRENIAGLSRVATITRQAAQKQATIPLVKSEKLLTFTIAKEFAFSRIKTDCVQIVSPEGTCSTPTALEVAQLLAEEGDFEQSQVSAFLREVDQSTANLALSLAWFAYQSAIINERVQDAPKDSPYQLMIQAAKETEPDLGPTILFERIPIKGHPLHPGTKTKIGMSPDEVFRYSPEFGGKILLHFAAVNQNYLQSSFPEKNKLHENDLFFQMTERLENEMRSRFGNKAAEYQVVPVHGWQWEHTIPTLFASELRDGIVHLLETTLEAWPTLSVRTVVPACHHMVPPHIKLPMNVQTTSAVRTLSLQAVQNGPLLTQALRHILEQEYECRTSIELLGELGGANYYSPLPDDRTEKARHLSFLLRENPDFYKREGESIVVAAALLEPTCGTDQPLIVQLLEESFPRLDQQEAAQRFLAQYCDVVLPALRLLAKYGIGLEAHLQNSLIAFHNGVPKRLLIRDLGGVRIDSERLSQQGYSLPFLAGSAILATREEAQNKLIHALFQNHLGEIILCLSENTRVSEESFWSIVKNKSQSLYTRYKQEQDPQVSLAAAQDEEILFAPHVHTKALTTMRLQGKVQAYSYLQAPNPLFAEEESKK